MKPRLRNKTHLYPASKDTLIFQYILIGLHLYCFPNTLCEHLCFHQVPNRELEFAWIAFHYACTESRIKARDVKTFPSVHISPDFNTSKLNSFLKGLAPTTPYRGHRLCLATSLKLQDIVISSQVPEAQMMLLRLFRSSLALIGGQSSSSRPSQRLPAGARTSASAQTTFTAFCTSLRAEVPNQPRPRHPNSPPNILSLHYRETHAPGRPNPNLLSPGSLHLSTD